jgi:hypothetical protein
MTMLFHGCACAGVVEGVVGCFAVCADAGWSVISSVHVTANTKLLTESLCDIVILIESVGPIFFAWVLLWVLIAEVFIRHLPQS